MTIGGLKQKLLQAIVRGETCDKLRKNSRLLHHILIQNLPFHLRHKNLRTDLKIQEKQEKRKEALSL